MQLVGAKLCNSSLRWAQSILSLNPPALRHPQVQHSMAASRIFRRVADAAPLLIPQLRSAAATGRGPLRCLASKGKPRQKEESE